MSCSELDDLLDEILSDQIFRSGVPSSSHNPPPDSSTGATRQRNGQPTCNTAPQLSNNNNNSNGGTRPRETAAAAKSWENSRAGRDDSEHDTRYQVKNQANDVTGTRKTTGGNTEACPEVGRSSENGADNQTAAGSRGRAPSVPVSHSPAANRYRRLQSVPCNDYYGGAQSSTSAQSYYDRSDRFVRGMCSEEPVTWLDRQKLKLQSRNENRWWWSNQSDQQKRLVEELKAAQTILRDGGGGGEQTTWRADRGADDANGQNRTSHKNQSLGGGHHQRPQHGPTATGPSMPTTSDGQLEGLDDLLLQPRGGMLSDASARSDAATSCKSEMNYYVSGVEIPPSTTHRTRYVFSVSSPPHSSSSASSSSFSRVNSSDGVNHLLQQTVQVDQRVSARPGPPTPKRVSSRDALRQTLAARDWELEQWEQGSYTSLSSKSDVAETSVAADDRGNGTAPARQPPASHLFSSVGCCTDRSGPAYDDVPSASRAHFLSTDGPAGDHNGLSPGRGPGLDRGPRLVVDGTSTTTTTSHGACTVDANGAGTTRSFDTLLLLNGSSSTSGTSSLSISSTSHQSAFEPVHQCPAALADGHVTYGDLHGAAFSAVSGNPSSKPPEPETVSASMVVAVQTSSRPVTDMRPSLSDFALGLPDSLSSRRSHNPTGNAPVRTSPIRVRAPVYEKSQARHPSNASSLPSDVPFPGAVVAVSVPSPKSQPDATVSLEKSSTSPRKKSEDVRGGQAMDSAGMIRKLPVSAEQDPPGSDGGMEVISLQLIGSGMQKLEPEGDLPAVRPVTPKCLQPGDANPLKSRPKSLGNPQRHNSSSEAASHSRPAVHQKFDPGPRRATIYDHTIAAAAAAAAAANSNAEQDVGSRTQLPEVLNGEDQTKQRLKHRRHTTSSGHVPGHSSSSEAPSTETAFRRTERLLSADFTAVQGGGGGSGGLLDRRGSASPSAGGDRPTTGRRGSTLPAASLAETSERTGLLLDGADDVFSSTKPPGGPERRNSKAHNKQRGEREREREVNLALLDSAVAGLRASASSPVDGSSSSSTVVQSPPPGKATPGVFPVRDPLSPRASIQPLSNGAVTTSSSNNSTDTTIRTNHAPRFVRDSSRFWHKPNISRDEAISSLKDKAPGSFVIRNSNSFPGAFGLALKVAHLPPNVQSRGGDPKAELVRHFLIEPTSKGVKLKGCSSEPVFGSLAALVYQHSMTPLSLPCKLIIPDPSSTRKRDDPTLTAVSDVATSEALLVGATCNVLYINSVDMESLTGNEAIDKAVAATFATTPTPLTTVVQLKVSSQGVTLTDVNRKQFFRRHYPVDTVTFAGIDPEMRSWIWTNEETKSAHKSNIFGFVARKQGSPMDNACHVFAELDRDQPGDAIVDFIMKVMLGQG